MLHDAEEERRARVKREELLLTYQRQQIEALKREQLSHQMQVWANPRATKKEKNLNTKNCRHCGNPERRLLPAR